MNMIKRVKYYLTTLCLLSVSQLSAWDGMDMPELHVKGRYLVDQHDNVVNLHGFAQTYSPWFNEQGSQWNNYDVEACLRYNQGIIDQVLAAGWDVNFIRLHMDPYWSNTPGKHVNGEADISAFDINRFVRYLDKVFVPMAEYAVDHGLYVVMRPPGVCPEKIAVGDDYQQYLIDVWTEVAQHEILCNHPNIMFELANEPVQILGTDGVYGGGGQPCFDALKQYFQPVVDAMRGCGCHNVLWVPGLGYQSGYSGFANNPIEGANIGYAVHIYPGWFGSNSADGYKSFKAGWDKDIKPVADIAPIMITEMDWAPEKYNSSWGKGVTGDDSHGFGANFMRLCDESGNASWLLFTGAELMAKFKDEPGTPGSYTFLNDPEACPWAVYHKFRQYREQHQYPWPDFNTTFASDRADGTFNNPVMLSDFPDVDMIRVGDTYYMMSTTMFYFPGATIMRSYDLVNWEYCANPIEYIELDQGYNLQNGQNRYSRGMWASAFQYHDGTFYILFNTLHEGAYLMTATDIEGKWTKRRLNRSFYDCGLLFDGDDIYVVRGNTELWVDKVDKDFNVLESHHVITGPSNNAVEGSRIYHIGDYYYIYSCYSGWPGKQTCFRSHNIYGPYEEKLLFDDRAIHQGAMVQTQEGDWWTILHRDMWPWGRVPYLMPVTMADGWPLIAKGVSNVDHLDKPAITVAHPTPHLQSTDAFRHYRLDKQWQWNHNPDESKWSLAERAGYLRLHTASVTDNFYQARNTLTQRMFGRYDDKSHSYGTIAIEIGNMADGDRMGLAILQDPSACIGVKKVDGVSRLYYQEISLTGKINTYEMDCGVVNTERLYLRAVASFLSPGKVDFYYSTDNVNYTRIGRSWTMQYDLSVFVGNRFAIFNYATKSLGGYVDVDWFSTEQIFNEEDYYSAEILGYTEESLTSTGLSVESKKLQLLTGSDKQLLITADFADGHTEDVTAKATYTVKDDDIISVSNGRVRTLRDGKSSLKVSYEDPLGNVRSVTFMVDCSTFPLVDGLFDPSIFGDGTFDASTHTVVTGQYGFGGWHYTNGVNLDDYKYIVAVLDKTTRGGVSFRLFDENNYWAGCALLSKQSAADYDYFVGDLHNLYKEDNSRQIDPSHIFYCGFWSYGGTPFVVRKVYVTNDEDEITGAVADVSADTDRLVDVYTIEGVMLMHAVDRASAVRSLSPGFYIIGGDKVLITQ